MRPAPAPDTTARLWVQVSASQSEAASRALVSELAAAHKLVQLVSPRVAGDGWRVVLGPFATRDDAEAAGRALGRPFFIVERALPAPDHP
jgi:cell division septation protein DedD